MTLKEFWKCIKTLYTAGSDRRFTKLSEALLLINISPVISFLDLLSLGQYWLKLFRKFYNRRFYSHLIPVGLKSVVDFLIVTLKNHQRILGSVSLHCTNIMKYVWITGILETMKQSWATKAMKRCDSISLPALNASSLHCLNFLPWLTFYCFIASLICLRCLNALTTKNINA